MSLEKRMNEKSSERTYSPSEAQQQFDNDPVKHPAHYNQGRIEVIEFLEDQQLEPHEWNSVKYICRAKHKGHRIQDLEKAIWYLKRKIELLSSEEKCCEPTRPNQMR